jgi:hypothetical protein
VPHFVVVKRVVIICYAVNYLPMRHFMGLSAVWDVDATNSTNRTKDTLLVVALVANSWFNRSFFPVLEFALKSIDLWVAPCHANTKITSLQTFLLRYRFSIPVTE